MRIREFLERAGWGGDSACPSFHVGKGGGASFLFPQLWHVTLQKVKLSAYCHPLKFVACFSGLLSDPSLSGQAASDCIWKVTPLMALNLICKFSHELGTTVSVRAGIEQLRGQDAGWEMLGMYSQMLAWGWSQEPQLGSHHYCQELTWEILVDTVSLKHPGENGRK